MAPRSLSISHSAVRLAAEFVIIVLGIVSALTVDGWAQGRAAAAQEYEYLTALHADMELNLEVAREMVAEHDRVATAAETVLDVVLGEGGQSLTYAELAYAIEVAGWNLLSPFVWDTWDDLISTGNNDVIDPEVRSAIQSFYGEGERMDILEAEWFEYQQRFRERASEVVPPRDKILIAGAGVAGMAFTGEGDVAALRARLRSTELLAGTLAEIVLTHRAGGIWYREIDDQIQETLELLEWGLGRE